MRIRSVLSAVSVVLILVYAVLNALLAGLGVLRPLTPAPPLALAAPALCFAAAAVCLGLGALRRLHVAVVIGLVLASIAPVLYGWRQRVAAPRRSGAGRLGHDGAVVPRMDATASIGAAAKQAGVSVEALRYYEAAGLMPAVPRDASGRRRYDQAALDQLDIIVTMRGVGFSVQQVRRMLTAKEPDGAAERIERARALLAELSEQIAEQRRRLDAADALMRSWEHELSEAGY